MTRLWLPRGATEAPRRNERYGAVKWCKRCGRKHATRTECDLVSVAVPAESGRMVQRLVHPGRRS